MDLEPKKFYISVIDLFAVLLPGALLTYEIAEYSKEPDQYEGPTSAAGWVAFLFWSYILGHFIFLLGAALLDKFLYDRIRGATRGQQIKRLAKGKARPIALFRFLARRLIDDSADEVQDRAIKIKNHYIRPLGLRSGLNAFQWCKARLILENHAELIETVRRFEADSKFFRSFAVVIAILIVLSFTKKANLTPLPRIGFLALGIFFLVLSLWRYIDQRLKSVNQSYWHVLALEAAAADGYRAVESGQKPDPLRAGGVVYREGKREAKYLIVEAKEAPKDWVLPKGHIEPEEDMRETAVREVLEETGIWARVESDLGIISFDLKDDKVKVQFYLMKEMARGKPQEQRETQWLSRDEAIKAVSYQESRCLLHLADRELTSRKSASNSKSG